MRPKNIFPPKAIQAFFRWFCKRAYVEDIEGDLNEVFETRAMQYGVRKAKWLYALDVLKLFRPGIIRLFEADRNLNNYGMLRSYFKIGWRNLVRSKGYSFITIGGLAIGMTVALLNGLWIWDELSYNKYFANYNHIAQISETGFDSDRGQTWLSTTMTYPLSTELVEHYGQKFKRIVRSSGGASGILSSGETKISSLGMYADDNVPAMFSFTMIYGTWAGLTDTHSIFISASLAKSLFGSANPMNQTVRMNNQTDVIVTGVYEDFPRNTHFYDMRFFAPWSLYLLENKWIEKNAVADWRNHFMKIYAEIPDGKSFQEVNSQIKGALQVDPRDREQANRHKTKLYLYPMSDWHLYPERSGRGNQDPIQMIKLIGAIGLFVLLLACVNFMNMSTARSEKRAKEVGIRKTIGSIRSQLINQFLSESLLVVIFAFFFAMGLAAASLPWFNEIAAKQIEIPWGNAWLWLSSFCFIIGTSALAGSYPAFYLSSFSPIRVLKGTYRAGSLAAIPRKVLVVFQFSISIMLIIGATIIYQQIQYAKNRPVGYDREGLIMVNKKTGDFYGKYEVLRNELKNTGVVDEVSESMGTVTEVASGNGGWNWTGHDPRIDQQFATLAVSHLQGKTVGWQFTQGRDFDLTMASDSSGIVVNESAAKIMALTNPVGEGVTWTWWVDQRVMNYKIIGVIKDMVMASPYAPAEPTVFYLKGFNGTPDWINIKINPNASVTEALIKIESVFKKIIPSAPFEYKFADEEYAKKFASEERIGKLAFIFGVMAILISCLGLLGLASFVAEQRTKEVGIRKVLGASVANLWKMLSREFVVLVLIACGIAIPFADYLLSEWLQKFEYRITISTWILLSTAVGAITITLLTVSYQAIRAASMNPVKSLRSE